MEVLWKGFHVAILWMKAAFSFLMKYDSGFGQAQAYCVLCAYASMELPLFRGREKRVKEIDSG